MWEVVPIPWRPVARCFEAAHGMIVAVVWGAEFYPRNDSVLCKVSPWPQRLQERVIAKLTFRFSPECSSTPYTSEGSTYSYGAQRSITFMMVAACERTWQHFRTHRCIHTLRSPELETQQIDVHLLELLERATAKLEIK